MGQILNDINAVMDNASLSPGEKRHAVAAIKGQALDSRVQPFLPYTLALDTSRSVKITQASSETTADGSAKWTVFGEYWVDGVLQPFAWPLVLINPPMISRSGSEDPVQAAREIMLRVFP